MMLLSWHSTYIFMSIFIKKYLLRIVESVQQSLEKKFGKAGGTIPITPSESFERRMGVSRTTDLDYCC